MFISSFIYPLFLCRSSVNALANLYHCNVLSSKGNKDSLDHNLFAEVVELVL